MIFQSLKHLSFLLLSICLVWTTSSSANTAASDEVVVEVSGNITPPNGSDVLYITREVIESLPQATITTSNHITSVPVKYRGPLFTDLLTSVSAKGDTVIVTAWDDYLAEIPIVDLKTYGVILATHEDGEQLSIENRGPLFVVFPFDHFPDIRNDLYYNKSVWQIKSIEVE